MMEERLGHFHLLQGCLQNPLIKAAEEKHRGKGLEIHS
jgi:hypothetical protein